MNKSLLNVLLTLAGFIIVLMSQAQVPTIGLLFSGINITDGYTLFTPESNQSVYLVNNCGEKVREWTFHEVPGATCYLLSNGSLLRAGKDSLTIRDWNNNLVWSYSMTDNGLNQNHDIEPLPNGNILSIVSKNYTHAEMISQGRDPSILASTFKMEKIVEIQPLGAAGANIVWEWNFMDHFIQDFDSTKLNFGNVEAHPELLDLNYDNSSLTDWTHVNSVDYNAALDQILISSRYMSEIYIIDHSTTTAEAASHSGGNSGKGGDFLWRWGNPQVYRQGGLSDEKLFYQHDAKWIEPGYMDEGKISVFNNKENGSLTQSSIYIISPEIDNSNYVMENSRFKPSDYFWSWGSSILGHAVNELKKGGTQALPNGNMVIAEASLGQVSEITRTGELVWSYRNPTGPVIYNQFDDILAGDNTFYKAEKYPSTFAGFSGKNMTPQGLIENQNANSDTCISTSGINYSEIENITIENPVVDGKVQFNRNILCNNIIIIDLNGKVVYIKGFFNDDNFEIYLNPAMYILKINSRKKMVNLKMIVL
jgi:hypothetical protein